MNNKSFILLPIFILLTHFLSGQIDTGFLVKPYLQFSTQTGMYILWETHDKATTKVEYGEATLNADQPKLKQTVVVKGLRTLHEVYLDQLKPETNYFYRVVSVTEDGKEWISPTSTFKTAVKDSSALMFALIGDTQRNNDTPWAWGKIAEKVWQDRPNFVVHVGDLVDKGLKKTDWTQHFFPYGHILMNRVPIYPVLGNHEQDSPLYYDYIVAPAPEYYYTFTYGNVQFFMLDSNRDIDEGSEQYNWLEWELSKSTATWKIAMHHHPPYTSDSNDYGDTAKELSNLGSKSRNLVPLYDKYGLDFCLYGHTHLYERSWPLTNDRINTKDGVIYINSGGAGGYIEDFAPTRSWFTTELQAVHHYCTFNIYQDQLIFKAIDHEGRLIDAFQMEKNKDKLKIVKMPPGVKIETLDPVFEKSTTVTLSAAMDDLMIYYTTDGTEPTVKSSRYSQPIMVDKTCIIRARAYTKDGNQSRITQQSVKKMSPQAPTTKKDFVKGLNFAYYEGDWKKIPDFSKLQAVKTGVMQTINLSTVAHREDHFGLLIEGYIEIPETGIRTFYINSDDGSKLYINDELLIDHDGDHSAMSKTGQTILSKGKHKIKIAYMEFKGSQHLQAGYLDNNKNEIPFTPFELWR
ncbi:MAG TPA: metallophosphoesterase [Saprospiraceae bacterium]|nr:metallophosphoesterase [Saprospiraceae bacterium]